MHQILDLFNITAYLRIIALRYLEEITVVFKLAICIDSPTSWIEQLLLAELLPYDAESKRDERVTIIPHG